MTADQVERTWAMGAQLEQLLENAWGAMRVADPYASEAEFRAALRMAMAKVVVRRLPESSDIERQAEILGRLFLGALREERGRRRSLAQTTRLVTAYDGPESCS